MNVEEMVANWEKEVVKRLTRAAVLWQNEARKLVSIPAPRKRSKRSGRWYATTPATPGAPPRKLSGQGRRGVAYRVDRSTLTAVGGTNVFYMEIHERRNHEWAGVALQRVRGPIDAALRGTA